MRGKFGFAENERRNVKNRYREEYYPYWLLPENDGDVDDAAYLDSAGSTLVKTGVSSALSDWIDYIGDPDGHHRLGRSANRVVDDAHLNMAQFLGVNDYEVALTPGATESLNMIALGMAHEIQEGDEIVVSIYEHHSSFLPWFSVAKQSKAKLKILYGFSDKELDEAITKRTKAVVVTGESNVTGYAPPLRKVVKKAHAVGAFVVADLALAAAHVNCNPRTLGVDFAALSAHKLYGPTGVGVLYAKEDYMMNRIKPVILGGGMVQDVTLNGYEEQDGAYRLEPGTANVIGAIALNAMLSSASEEEAAFARNNEDDLTRYAKRRLEAIEGVEIYGAANGVISFNVAGANAFALAAKLDW